MKERGTNEKQPLETFPYMSESEICLLGSQWAIQGLEHKHVKDILLFTGDTVQVDGGWGRDRRILEELLPSLVNQRAEFLPTWAPHSLNAASRKKTQ